MGRADIGRSKPLKKPRHTWPLSLTPLKRYVLAHLDNTSSCTLSNTFDISNLRCGDICSQDRAHNTSCEPHLTPDGAKPLERGLCGWQQPNGLRPGISTSGSHTPSNIGFWFTPEPIWLTSPPYSRYERCLRHVSRGSSGTGSINHVHDPGPRMYYKFSWRWRNAVSSDRDYGPTGSNEYVVHSDRLRNKSRKHSRNSRRGRRPNLPWTL